MATFPQTLKETMADPGDPLKLRWIDLRDTVVTLNRSVRGHKPRQIKVSNKLISMLNALSKKEERIFPTTLEEIKDLVSTGYQKVNELKGIHTYTENRNGTSPNPLYVRKRTEYLNAKLSTKRLKCGGRLPMLSICLKGGINLVSKRYSGRKTVGAKIEKLTPESRAVNIVAKVLSKGEVREVTSQKDGKSYRVCDVLVGDETGCVYLSLWNEDIEKVNKGDTISIENGYVKIFRGQMRLNVGKYGTLKIAEEPLEGEVNTENNLSDRDYRRRPYR